MITQMFGIGRTHFVDLLRMSNETKNEISGILLAGGKARRMGGVNKGAQLLGGRTLAGLVIERMKPQVKSIFISSNEFAAEFDSYGYPVFKDVRQDYPGPLAGIETILKQAVLGISSHRRIPRFYREIWPDFCIRQRKRNRHSVFFQLTKVKRNLCTACFIKTSCPR